jgi:hypothetical protein
MITSRGLKAVTGGDGSVGSIRLVNVLLAIQCSAARLRPMWLSASSSR